MRIGIVCPYSFDAPGGVQFHIRDLAQELIARGHDVSVLAPAEDEAELTEFVVAAGGSVAIPYNGSVARLNFGPGAVARVARWLTEGDFDLLHIHEPLAPSLGLIALWQAKVPVVATFHSAQDHSRAMAIASPAVQGLLEKINARIAVSEEARRTLADHLGGDAVVIPNGVYLDSFGKAAPDQRFTGLRHGGVPTVCFLGRIDEPRKGLAILAEAIGPVLAEMPNARFLIAGRGDATAIREQLAGFGESVEFLGGISDADKNSLLASVDVYCAPQTGGESFGIVLVEAMAGGATVVASDIPAFRAVLNDGHAGLLFATEDSQDLASKLLIALRGGASAPLAVRSWASHFDWSIVATQILEVYELVLSAREVPAPRTHERSARRPRWQIWGRR